MKILIVDDHALVRQGVKRILEEAFPTVIVGEAESSREALELTRKQDWNVILLDITMPGRNGMDFLKELRSEGRLQPVLVLSAHPEEQYAVRVMKAGAAGYLTKHVAAEELVAAVRKVARNERYITHSLADKMASFLHGEMTAVVHQSLTNREDQVMRLLAAGQTVSEIAKALSLSVKTISTHRARILEKLRLRNNSELMRYALEHKLIE